MSDEREGLRAREIRAHLLGDAEQFGARRDREPRDQYEAIGRNMLAAVDLIDALLREGGEPVAWLVDIEGDHPHATIDREDAERDAEHARGHTGKPVRVVPLYASPVASAPVWPEPGAPAPATKPPLGKIRPSDPEEEREAAKDNVIRFLFGLLDDIDTASDMAKADEALYRTMVERIQARRWECGVTTDGYTLDLSALRATQREGGGG